MITYLCKYTPLELLAALGAPLEEPNADVEDFRRADALIHTSVCTHAKMLIETALDALSSEEPYDAAKRRGELILTNCCDSVRRVYDTLSGETFSYMKMLDLPHDASKQAVSHYAEELRELKNEYEKRSGAPFRRDILLREWKASADRWETFQERSEPFIAILGARTSDQLRTAIRNLMPYPVVDLTCGGIRTVPRPEVSGMSGRTDLSDDELLLAYTEALLSQIPCTRMKDISARETLFMNRNLAGIVYHTVKFCDYYSFEYADIRRKTALPMLKIESDYTSQSAGQLDTRLKAFAESLDTDSLLSADCAENQSAATKTNTDSTLSANCAENQSAATKTGTDSPLSAGRQDDHARAESPSVYLIHPGLNAGGSQAMGSIFVGIDSGSTSTNAAALDDNGRLVAWSIVRTGAKAAAAAENALRDVKNQLGANASSIRKIVATGYGREFIPFADSTKTEISCHARGAHFADPKARTIIDIGGQDSKVICLDEDGNVMNFVMNDKCAAGTGRFLEMMAQTLEMSMDEIGQRGLRWKKDLTISSTCTVFAESEVVGLIAENTETDDIIHALNKSVAARASGMVKRVRGTGPFMMTGGVAKNKGVAKEIERRLGERLTIMEHPDLIGAIGAALFAGS